MIISILFSLTFARAEDLGIRQMHAEYLRACGGKIYSKCDAPGRSQATLFEAAVARAKDTGRLVLMVVGADWCAPCVVFARKFERNAAFRERLEKRNVVVELNVEVASTRQVLARLKQNAGTFPAFFIYDPQNGAIQRLEVSENDETGIAALAGEIPPPTVTRVENQNELGGIRWSVLRAPLVRAAGRFGTSDIEISTRLTGDDRAKLIASARQAFNLFEGFDWTNSMRAIAAGLALENDNPVLLALSALNAGSISQGSTYVIETIDRAARAARTFPLDEDDRKFVALTRTLICSEQKDACDDANIRLVAPKDAVKRVLPFGKTDYQAFFLFVADEKERLEDLARERPAHSAAHHYLTHVYESDAKPELAALQAQIYVEMASDLPHAHHMYGHLLPQLGRWDEALAQFKIAHELHLAEFATEGLERHEDWHYQHNVKLLASTLVHLDKIPEALELFGKMENLTLWFDLLAAQGRFAEVSSKLREFNLDLSTLKDGRVILLLLGQRRFAEAERLIEDARANGYLDDPAMLNARIAYVAIRNDLRGTRTHRLGSAERRLLPQLATEVSKPGFDGWSSTTIQRAILSQVLRANDLGRVARRVEALPGFTAGGLCTTAR